MKYAVGKRAASRRGTIRETGRRCDATCPIWRISRGWPGCPRRRSTACCTDARACGKRPCSGCCMRRANSGTCRSPSSRPCVPCRPRRCYSCFPGAAASSCACSANGCNARKRSGHRTTSTVVCSSSRGSIPRRWPRRCFAVDGNVMGLRSCHWSIRAFAKRWACSPTRGSPPSHWCPICRIRDASPTWDSTTARPAERPPTSSPASWARSAPRRSPSSPVH